jgi:16S rRNA C967 or C1407 C5-methylase (RsmB/RsmF family)
MAKKDKNTKTGVEAFEKYYSELYGERWASLRAALLDKSRQLEYSNSLLKPYYLDIGSVRAAMTLPLENAEKIADFCAAPGGKSLVIATLMMKNATLVSNERSRERKNRLKKVLDEHLKEDVRSRVSVLGFDASRWCNYERNAYDRILLDVPCSSERHVIADAKYLSQWSPARIRNLATTQWALLSSAFLVLKNGGYMVYSTCALSNAENDDVISKLIKKYPEVDIVPLEEKGENGLCDGEKTEYGIHVLPDKQNGAGPLFFSLIHKKAIT